QRERHSHGTEVESLKRVLEIEIRDYEHERRLTGPSPDPSLVHASRERDTPRHGYSDDTLLGQASNRGCVGAVLLPAGNLGPPPVLGAFLAESETKRESLLAEGRSWEGAPMKPRRFSRQEAEKQLSQVMDGLVEAFEGHGLGMADVGDDVGEADAEPEFMELDSADAVEEASPVVETMEVDEATGGYEAAYHLVEEDPMEMEEGVERVPAELGVTSEETERVFEEDSVAVLTDEREGRETESEQREQRDREDREQFEREEAAGWA
ncbi:hypothetical protein RUND412_011325, partial [Rhizina undulata]